MTIKADLLTRAAEEYTAFHEAVAGLNEEQLTLVWLGAWSVKDIVAHLSGWHREMTPALERIAQGQRPVTEGVSYDDVDRWNAKFAAASRDVEAALVLLELDKSHYDFLQAAAKVPDERFAPGKTAYKIVEQNSAHHYREHGDQIRAWRASKGI